MKMEMEMKSANVNDSSYKFEPTIKGMKEKEEEVKEMKQELIITTNRWYVEK